MLCHMIILHMWPIPGGCQTKAKLWLISKTISKDKDNNSLECNLTSKQVQKFTTQNLYAQSEYALKDNKKFLDCNIIDWRYMI